MRCLCLWLLGSAGAAPSLSRGVSAHQSLGRGIGRCSLNKSDFQAGATVLHQVDATSLRIEGSWCCDFQRIIFNFPYQALGANEAALLKATGGIKGLRRLLGSFLETLSDA